MDKKSILIILGLHILVYFLTGLTWVLFPITIPLSIWIYYLVNEYGKKENSTEEKHIEKKEDSPLGNKISFNKPNTLRLLISTSTAFIILIF